MSEVSQECTHDCSSCGADCGSRSEGAGIQKEKLGEGSSVKKVIGVVSGKGGVGKSLVTALSAVAASRNGYKTAILDADITGPSIPKMFGIHEKASATELGIIPGASDGGIQVMSLNLLDRKSTRLNSSHP